MADDDRTLIIDKALDADYELAEKVMTAVEKLVERRDKTGDVFSSLMSVLLRRNYYTGFSILSLASDIHNGPAALDLARQMIEDVVNLEWIVINGSQKQSKKFDTFAAIDALNTIKDAKLIGVDINKQLTKKEQKSLIEGDKKARKSLRMNADENRRSYNKRSVEQMIEDIAANISKSPLTKKNLDKISWLYVQGNAKNHTSPGDLLWYLQEEKELLLHLKWCLSRALYITHTVIFHLALRYTQYFLTNNPKDELASKVQSAIVDIHKASSR
jgi:hypothetical protein